MMYNDTKHKNLDATMHQSYSTFFNSNGKRIHTLKRLGLVTIYRLPSGHIVCSIRVGVVLFAKVCFFLPVQFCKVVDLHWLFVRKIKVTISHELQLRFQ